MFAEAGGTVNTWDSNDTDAPTNAQGGRASEGIGEVKFSGGSGGGAFQGQGEGFAGGGGAAGYLADGGNMGVQATAISSGGGNNVNDSGGSFSQTTAGGGGVGVYGNIFTNTGTGYSIGVDGGQNGYPYKTETIGNGNYKRGDNWAGAGYGGGNGIRVSGSGNDTVNPIPPEPFGGNGEGLAGRPNNGALRIIYGPGRFYPNSGTQELPQTPRFVSEPVTFTITPGETRTWSVEAESPDGNTITYSCQIFSANSVITLDDISVSGNEISVTYPINANDDAAFELIVLATDDVTGGVIGQNTVFTPIIVAGQTVYDSPGIHTFTVPPRVYNISAVVVGGGGGGSWQGSAGGTGGTSKFGEGESFYFYATGGQGGGQGQSPASYTGGQGGVPGGTRSGGGSGGAGKSIASNNQRGAGGGAGGYAGNGGNGEGFNVHPQTVAGEGGGVGIYGQGASGAGSLVWLHTGFGVANGSGGSGTGGGGYSTFFSTYGSRQIDGMAGSGGSQAAISGVDTQWSINQYGGGGAGAANDGTYGAGAGGGALAYASNIAVTPGQQITVEVGDRGSTALIARGGTGAARIIWGPNRRYPASNTLDAGISILNTETEFVFPQNSTQTISFNINNPASEDYTYTIIPLTDRLTQDNFSFTGDDLEIVLPGDDISTDHKFTVLVATTLGYKDAVDFTITPVVSSGEQIYTTPGSYTFTVPDGVGTIYGVAVGGGAGGAVGTGGAAGGAGGGLGWGPIEVVPGTDITIAVGEGGTGNIGGGLANPGGDSLISYNDATIIAGYGGTAGDGQALPNLGGTFTAPSNGGGGNGGQSQIPGSGFQYASGGGGAGGYSGNGGNGGTYSSNPGDGQGGGGAGGFAAGASIDSAAGGGGGVGLYGEGPSGIVVFPLGTPAPGGSNGAEGSASDGTIGGDGGSYGGGGGASNGSAGTNPAGGNGQSGAVRLVWGEGVSYPVNAVPATTDVIEYSATVQSFFVPTDVTSLSVVAVGSGGPGSFEEDLVSAQYSVSGIGGGGGAISYSENISVTPGELLDIVFDGNGSGLKRGSTWLVYAEDGVNEFGGNAANGIGDVKFSGGNGAPASQSQYSFSAGGGGAGTYTDPGGSASSVYVFPSGNVNTGDRSTLTRSGAGLTSDSAANKTTTAGGGGVGMLGTYFKNDSINLIGGGAYTGQNGIYGDVWNDFYTYRPTNGIGGAYGGGTGVVIGNIGDAQGEFTNYSVLPNTKPNNGAVSLFFGNADTSIPKPSGNNEIFIFDVINNGSSAYTVTGTDRTGAVSGDNPNITVNEGDIIVFNVNATGHPLYFKTSNTTGTGDTVTLAEQQGTETGKLNWSPKVAGTYFYICQFHSSMVGTIIVLGNS